MSDPGPGVVIPVVAIVMGMVVIFRPIVRAVARRLEGQVSDPRLSAELDEIKARVAETEQLRERVAELEERLDFAERLLARKDDIRQLSD